MSRTRLAVASAAFALTAVAACGSSSKSSERSTSSSTSPIPATAVNANAVTATCGALVPFGAAVLAVPGSDPDSPPPSASELMAWAATASPPLQTIAKNAPAEFNADIQTLLATVHGAAHGKPVDTESSALSKASSALDHWGHDNCGFTRLDIVNNGNNFTGLPATLPAGPVSISFTNQANPKQSAIVLLVGRIKDGATYDLDKVRNNTEGIQAFADIVAATSPGSDGGTGYETASLRAGHYLLTSPIGTPPNFTKSLVQEFQVP